MLAFLGAGAVASLFTRDQAQAGHDGTNIFHLGEYNVVPPDASLGTTLLDANVPGRALDVRNSGTAKNAGGVEAWSHGGGPAVQGNAFAPGSPGVAGISHLSPAPEDFGKGSGTGVSGGSGSGFGVYGTSDSNAGVFGNTTAAPRSRVTATPASAASSRASPVTH